jgi:predicted Co/Zn/Cd cation transporter (cation efflux family)
MEEQPNPFQAPIADAAPPSIEYLSGYEPEGFPHPNVLAWIGVGLAAGIVVTLFVGNFSFLPALFIFPTRIAWVIYARIQMRRHQDTWSPGSRTFLMSVWIINLLILSIDGMLILLFATCLVAFG